MKFKRKQEPYFFFLLLMKNIRIYLTKDINLSLNYCHVHVHCIHLVEGQEGGFNKY